MKEQVAAVWQAGRHVHVESVPPANLYDYALVGQLGDSPILTVRTLLNYRLNRRRAA